jgi:hypothetical protein
MAARIASAPTTEPPGNRPAPPAPKACAAARIDQPRDALAASRAGAFLAVGDVTRDGDDADGFARGAFRIGRNPCVERGMGKGAGALVLAVLARDIGDALAEIGAVADAVDQFCAQRGLRRIVARGLQQRQRVFHHSGDIGLRARLGDIGLPFAPDRADQRLAGLLRGLRLIVADIGLDEILIGADAEDMDVDLQLFQQLAVIGTIAPGPGTKAPPSGSSHTSLPCAASSMPASSSIMP